MEEFKEEALRDQGPLGKIGGDDSISADPTIIESLR
jgi:hypothetical protein